MSESPLETLKSATLSAYLPLSQATARLIICLHRVGIDAHVKILSSDPLVEIKHVITILLKVRGCVKGFGDETLVCLAISYGFVCGGHSGKALKDWSQKRQTRSKLLLRLVLLQLGRDNGNVDTPRRNGKRVGHGADEDVINTAHLWSRDHNLTRITLACVGDRVVQKANAPRHLARGTNLLLWEVGRISNHHLCLGHFIATPDSICFAILVEENFIHITIQHESSSVNGADARESLGKASKTVHGVNIRTVTIPGKRVAVNLKLFHRMQSGLVKVCLIKFEAHCVRNKLMRLRDHSKVQIKLAHRHFSQIPAIVRSRISMDVLVNVNKELTESALFQYSHE
mmetsp:Transcript_28973/g.53019  ORF Transcript_28973/g.53019 Transcript_28973/m.53019 type:complete len:342 (+) Transcript_28973:248-1273(+)